MMVDPLSTIENESFLSSGGDEMGARMRAHDWTNSPLGPIRIWPQALRTTVRLMLQSKHPMFVAWGPDLAFLYNDGYIPIFGAKHPNSLGLPFRQVWADIWHDIEPLIARALRGEATWSENLHLVMQRNGYPEDTWYSFSYSPAHSDNDEIAGMFCACTETTGRMVAEKALRELNDTLESQVAQRTSERDGMWRISRDLFAVVEPTGIFQAINPAWTEILGWTADQIVGRHCADFIHPEDIAGTREAVAVSARGALPPYVNRYRHRDGGYRWISWTAAPQEGLIYATGRDVTAERRAAAELESAHEALRQSQKMEAIGQLTGGIAHDFNNLLQGIIGSLNAIQRRWANGRLDDSERFITGAITSANRAAALTHRLLAFSRRQALQPEPIDLNSLVGSMQDLIDRTLGVSIEKQTFQADNLWLTHSDRHQLESSLLNLVINARDAMPDGGTLTIATRNAVQSGQHASQHDGELAPGEYVALSIADTGTGMTQDVIRQAFEPFFTTKPLGQGTGLGLSMVYGFVRQSQGAVGIDSEIGCGTTVTLYFPRYTGALTSVDAPTSSIGRDRTHTGKTVLTVEDDQLILDLVGSHLTELGYKVLTAKDGPSGLEMVLSQSRIDLLLTDIGLPGLNGRQLADAARLRRPRLPVVLMTGYADTVAARHGPLADGMAIVTKPFDLDALARKIGDMLSTQA